METLNEIIKKIACSHNYPKVSQETKLELFKYFIELGANLSDIYVYLFTGCFYHGDYLVLKCIVQINPQYDFSQIFQNNQFIDAFSRIYNIGLFDLEHNHSFLSNELELSNNILKCKLMIELGYKPPYSHELYDYYESLYNV
jgi:hypothetical protein